MSNINCNENKALKVLEGAVKEINYKISSLKSSGIIQNEARYDKICEILPLIVNDGFSCLDWVEMEHQKIINSSKSNYLEQQLFFELIKRMNICYAKGFDDIEKIGLIGATSHQSSSNKMELLDYLVFNLTSEIQFILVGKINPFASRFISRLPIINRLYEDRIAHIKANIKDEKISIQLSYILYSLPNSIIYKLDNEAAYKLIMTAWEAQNLVDSPCITLEYDQNSNIMNLFIILQNENGNYRHLSNSILEYFRNLCIKKKIESVSSIVPFFVNKLFYLSLAISAEDYHNISNNLTQILKDLETYAISWEDNLLNLLSIKYPYHSKSCLHILTNNFSEYYKQLFSAQEALVDIENTIMSLLEEGSFGSEINNSDIKIKLLEDRSGEYSLKLYRLTQKIELSDVFHQLDSIGFKVISEQHFEINFADNLSINEDLALGIWHLHKIRLSATKNTFSFDKANLEQALRALLNNIIEIDPLNKLILHAGLKLREIQLLQALIQYLVQIQFQYSSEYVKSCLTEHKEYVMLLIRFFHTRFDPNIADTSESQLAEHSDQLEKYLAEVNNNDEDKILRQILFLIKAIVRTNFYQTIQNRNKKYISFKINPVKIPGVPLPIPYAEIFVYAGQDFEGVHLRGGKVARGGIRWSDRKEDYRIEVLGLMKAQITKNTLIVPTGAKGGFYLKFSDAIYSHSPQQYQQKVISCYKNFLRGMLDITDNIINGIIVAPQNVKIYDDPDPYLVVAADKGTATFSDYANEVSAEYHFWLGDAFASGSSTGYDHKKIGITSKGAWISVQRHLKEIDLDLKTNHITTVGIGDMSGDVFGNGLLRSKNLKLLAAFNHQHIFVDPDPDVLISYQERLRLFNAPKSKWSDYNNAILSKGGAIFERNTKNLKISPEIQELLTIKKDIISPEELIKAIICLKVDLIWNGGIGTYLKASEESNYLIKDKANDNLRCNGNQIKARVFAEGGNLGVSQLGRVEYSKNGGMIYADFIDNSAGVNCSDHEVNIKIILNKAVALGHLSLEDRNKLLVELTPCIESLVLVDNYNQTEAISICYHSPFHTFDVFLHLIHTLEEDGMLVRENEFLPTDSEINRRILAKDTITRPEIAVLLSYSKMLVYKGIIGSKMLEDEACKKFLIGYFPKQINERFLDFIENHPLRREILATEIVNKIVNRLTGPIINTIQQETGALICDIVRAFIIICEVFDLDTLWEKISTLLYSEDVKISVKVQVNLFTEIIKLMRRGICWLISNFNHPIEIYQTIENYRSVTQKYIPSELLVGKAKSKFENKVKYYLNCDIDLQLAEKIAALENFVSLLDVFSISKLFNIDNQIVTKLYFLVGERLEIDLLRGIADSLLENQDYWQRLAVQSIQDDLYDKQFRLVRKIVEYHVTLGNKSIDLEVWFAKQQKYLKGFINFVDYIKAQEHLNLNMVILANKKLENFLLKIQDR